MGLKVVLASDNILYGATVATQVGATAATYDDDHLCDGRNRPVQATSGSVRWAATAPASGQVDVVVLHSHNVDAARPIAIAGDVAATGAGPAARANGIPVNPWIPVNAPGTATTVSVEIANNSKVVTIAEMLAGAVTDIGYGPIYGFRWGYLDIGKVMRRSVGGSVPNFDRRLIARWCQGQILMDLEDQEIMEEWREGTRNDVRPSAMLPVEGRNDAWVGSLISLDFETVDGLILATFEFHEWARKLWVE